MPHYCSLVGVMSQLPLKSGGGGGGGGGGSCGGGGGVGDRCWLLSHVVAYTAICWTLWKCLSYLVAMPVDRGCLSCKVVTASVTCIIKGCLYFLSSCGIPPPLLTTPHYKVNVHP